MNLNKPKKLSSRNRNAKKVAIVHILFNLIGTFIFLFIFYGIGIFVNFTFMDSLSFRLLFIGTGVLNPLPCAVNTSHLFLRREFLITQIN